jgi:quinohemoprotein ethanol dehydrogenase
MSCETGSAKLTTMSEGQVGAQPHEELWNALRQRLVDEGLPTKRAEGLATALLDADTRPEALKELDGRLDRVTDLLERLDTQVERVADSLEGASSPPPAPQAETSTRAAAVAGAAHESATRHPVHAVEHEVEHLYDTAEEGESPATPAIVGGGVLAFLVPLAAILIAFAFAVYYVASRGGSSEPSSAPAFTADELAAPSTDNWITNGGTTFNQRYSPLDEIDTTNVSRLKGVWHTHLRGSGTGAKYSAEGQPIVYDGVVYQATGADDVFAVDVDSGEIKWQYKANLDQKISTVCCGWLSRGVALGDGKVYVGQLDGKLVALDQKDGSVAWSRQVERWQDGYTITAAPLYFNGLVITGVAGGEYRIRGRVTAFDAKTGKEVWRFYTIPGPDEVGHDTWPAASKSWQQGGAPIWQTPAVDSELGLLYFSTGNASPDLDGSRRAGDNLFTSSIVALDAKTGKYRWHFQEVHHDLWDYDAPSPVVLFDVDVEGRTRHALGQTGKTGWTYLVDRETGKPLYRIEERPVPQDAYQRTAKTQPFPSNQPVVPHRTSPTNLASIRRQLKQNSKGGVPPLLDAPIFTPPVRGRVTVVSPGPPGGDNWPPMSYSPKTQMLYVCAQASSAGYLQETRPKPYDPSVADFGSISTPGGGFSSPGTFSAVDVRSGRIVWQKRWKDSCYSGSTAIGGNVVFVGRNGGELQAYDARNGSRLWSFQTGAGANSSATVFEDNGTEYVAFYAGGNALAGTRHGDNLWLFSLDGSLGPVAAGGGGTAQKHAGEAAPPPSPPSPAGGNAGDGKGIFASNCSTCHGATGQGGNGGPDLTAIPSAKNLQRVTAQVRNGGGGMPSFKGTLTEQQIQDVATYVTTKITNKK